MLRALGQAKVSVECLPQALAERAKRHKGLLKRLRHLDDTSPEVTRLKKRARTAAEQGEYADAERLWCAWVSGFSG